MKLKFLDIYDVTDLFTNGIKDKYSPPYIHMYIQEDVLDFHVYRIQQGDYEGNSKILTLEHEKVDKGDLVEKMGLYNRRVDVRNAFENADGYKVLMNVLKYDADNGYEQWEYHTFEELEDAQELVHGDFYTVHPVAFIAEPLKETN